MKTTKWKKLSPKSEFYLFIPRNEKLFKYYDKYKKITEIFPTNSVGIVTSRDKFVIDPDKEALKRRIRMLINEKIPDKIIEQTFGLKDKSNWALNEAREKIRKDSDWKDSITQITYRPFDIQWIFYNDSLIERSRKEIMQNLLSKDNIALITSRLTKGETFKHAQVSSTIVEVICMSPKTSNNGFVFPLYLYPDTEKKDLFSNLEKDGERKPNFNPEFYKTLCGVYEKDLSPEEIFYYIYGVLYSNTYRTKYAEFLKIDFPRVPFTKSYEVFSRISNLGEILVKLHLLKSSELDSPIAKFQGKGDEKVGKPVYKDGHVYINKEQFFEGIEKDVWEYQIGGYQVCNKWLKDRKGRKLSLEDIKHYCKVVTALKKTIEIQERIDDIYEEIEKDLIEFQDK